MTVSKEDIYFVTDEEHQLITLRLLENGPYTEAELLQKFEAVTEWLNKTRIDAALWENLRKGTVGVDVDANGELLFKVK